VAIRKAGIPIQDIRRTIDAWRAVLPIQAADDGDLAAALEAVRAPPIAVYMVRICCDDDGRIGAKDDGCR
jgi:hypothetical protein